MSFDSDLDLDCIVWDHCDLVASVCCNACIQAGLLNVEDKTISRARAQGALASYVFQDTRVSNSIIQKGFRELDLKTKKDLVAIACWAVCYNRPPELLKRLSERALRMF